MAKRFVRRGFRGRRRRQRGAWVNDTFSNILDGNVVAGGVRLPHVLSLFERDDYLATAQIMQKRPTLLHVRADIQWNFRGMANGTGTALTLSALCRWALVIADDNEVDLNATVLAMDVFNAGNPLQGGLRVLKMGQVGAQITSPTTTTNVLQFGSDMQPHTIVSWSGRKALLPEESVFLILYLSQPTSDIDQWFLVNADTLSRCYVRTG